MNPLELLELLEEQRRLYPDFFRTLDAVLDRLTLEQNVRLNVAVAATFPLSPALDLDDGDASTYTRALLAVNASLEFDGMDPDLRALDDETIKTYADKLGDLDMKNLTQNKEDHS